MWRARLNFPGLTVLCVFARPGALRRARPVFVGGGPRGYLPPVKPNAPIAGARVAILGGGQLGTMLATAAQPLRVVTHALDPDPAAPAAYNAQACAEGDFRDRRTVEAFARHADVCTIEIEAVSTAGLRALRDEHGVPTRPSPEVVELIQDKGTQKAFYARAGLPTAPFALHADADAVRAEVAAGRLRIPFVQKLRRGGYDGKGVQIVRTEGDLARLLPGECLTEALADYRLELAVVAARRPSGEVTTFPVVEMDFDPEENLVTQLISPARVDERTAERARAIAADLATRLGVEGLLAVEFFLLRDGALWINEAAPRPHNSGHVTMDGFATSQFEQHLRAVLDVPLGSTRQYRPAVMINLLGSASGTGPATYVGLADALALPGVHVHLYGKATTKPHRKMGHVNVVADTIDEAIALARRVRDVLRVEPAPPPR